jgi:hypothetical protein
MWDTVEGFGKVKVDNVDVQIVRESLVPIVDGSQQLCSGGTALQKTKLLGGEERFGV